MFEVAFMDYNEFLFELIFTLETFLLVLFDLLKRIVSFGVHNLSFFNLYEGTGEHISKPQAFL